MPAKGYKKRYRVEKTNNQLDNQDIDNAVNISEEPIQEETQQPDNPTKPSIDDNTISLLAKIKEQNEYLTNELIEQKKKVAEQEQKINDVINTATQLLQNPQALAPVIQKMMGGSQQPSASTSENAGQQTISEPKDEVVNQAKQEAIKSVLTNPMPAKPAMNLDTIKQIANAVAVITSNMGGGRRESNPGSIIENIQSSVGLASQIAGALGEGLGKMFDGFNQMQERAWKSWQKRTVSQKVADKIDKNTLKEVIKDIIIEEQKGGGE